MWGYMKRVLRIAKTIINFSTKLQMSRGKHNTVKPVIPFYLYLSNTHSAQLINNATTLSVLGINK